MKAISQPILQQILLSNHTPHSLEFRVEEKKGGKELVVARLFTGKYTAGMQRRTSSVFLCRLFNAAQVTICNMYGSILRLKNYFWAFNKKIW